MTVLKPMLSGKTDGTDVDYPVLGSPKLDGVRALIIDGKVMSRKLKLIPNKYVQNLFGRKEFNGFDGELIVGPASAPDVYNATMSGVMSVDGEPDVVFHVFDDYSIPLDGFEDRYKSVISRFMRIPLSLKSYLRHVIHVRIVDEQTLYHYEEKYVSHGYEGIMIRSIDGLYKYGRSTDKQGWLLKMKRFEDSEAKIVGWKEQMTNTNEATISELGGKVRSSKKEGMVPAGKLGAWIAEDLKTGVEFDCGTGFSDDQRVEFWKNKLLYKHAIFKYKFQPAGVKNKPRFPTFIGFRSKIDL